MKNFSINNYIKIIGIIIIVLLFIISTFLIVNLSNNKTYSKTISEVLSENKKNDNINEEYKNELIGKFINKLLSMKKSIKEEKDLKENEQASEPIVEKNPEDKSEFITQEDNRAVSIPVLAYHNFMTNSDRNIYAPNDKYTMSIESFEQQLKYLYDNGYHTIDYKTLYRWLKNEIELDNKSFMITIDDGNISAYHLAIPVIEKYDYLAIIFVITGRIKEISNSYDPVATSFFGDDIISDIKNNHKNITLGSHSTYLHAVIDGKNPMEVLSYDELLSDLSNSQQCLNTEVFAYPFGMYNDNYLNAAKNAGFLIAFTFKPSARVRRTNNVYEVPRININSEVSFDSFKYLVEQDW